MKIYVIAHAEFKAVTASSTYETLYVGCDLGSNRFSGLKDNIGADNISNKNNNYCELTGIYWIWKNSKEDIVGICHYRRYFIRNPFFLSKYTLLSNTYVYKVLANYDVILPCKNVGEYKSLPAKEFFDNIHGEGMWNVIRDVIVHKAPDYIGDYDYFGNCTTGYCFNMFVIRKERFDDYCKWLFDILFELEKKIDFSALSTYNQRMMGFVSERLLNVWVIHNKLRIKELPVFNTDSDKFFFRLDKHIRNWMGKNKGN